MSAEDAAPAATAPVKPRRDLKGDAGFMVVVVIIVAAVLVPARWRDAIGPILVNYPTPDQYSVPDPIDLPLLATVRLTGTQFVIENRSDEAWMGVRITVNGGVFGGGYRYECPRMASHATATIDAPQFVDDDGTRFNPMKQKARWVRVTATAGGELRSWGGDFQPSRGR